MELKNLSQNWRRLQPTLTSSKSQSQSRTKRKAARNDNDDDDDDDYEELSLPAKRLTVKRIRPVDIDPKRRRTDFAKRRRRCNGNSNANANANNNNNMAYVGSVEESSCLSKLMISEEEEEEENRTGKGAMTLNSGASVKEKEDGTRVKNDGLSTISDKDIGKYVALDCEMVGVGPSPRDDSALARVSVVDYHGEQVYDSYVRPKERVTDWRTPISGITPRCMTNARSLEEVWEAVSRILDGRILVGHDVRHDLKMLMIAHPKRDIRDTCKHPPFRKYNGGGRPSLKLLASAFLGLEIQNGAHSSVEDARACMLLYRREKAAFEREHAKNWPASRAPNINNRQETETNGPEEEKGPKRRKNTRKKKKKKKRKKH